LEKISAAGSVPYPYISEAPGHSRVDTEEAIPEEILNMERFENELFFYVRTGDVSKLKSVLDDESCDGLLFTSRMKQSFFRFSMRVTELLTLARFASIQGGCSPETTHRMFGLYIENLEECHNYIQASVLLKRSLIEFTSLTRGILDHKNGDYSPLVIRCINRILERMPERTTLNELSGSLNVTPKYLSTLFNRETGMSITDYMQDIRINEAKFLLAYSEMNYPDISNLLCYGSQSYFNQVFKKKTGITPREYRARERGSNENSRHNK